MDQIIAIGDIHGRTVWKDIVGNFPSAHIVFLGDYLDPYSHISDELLLENLQDIIQFKKENPQRVTLLMGNHDAHYLYPHMTSCTRYNYHIATEASILLGDPEADLRLAYGVNGILFTHAGITKTWLERFAPEGYLNDLADQLNDALVNLDPLLFSVGKRRGGRYNEVGGPIWADVTELDDLPDNLIQVVGHNQVLDIRDETFDNGSRIFLADALAFGKYWDSKTYFPD